MIIDVISLVIFLYGFYRGFVKGFIFSVFSFFAFFIGIIAALKFVHTVSVMMQGWFDINSKYLPFVAFILVFIGVIFLIRTLARLLTRFMNLLQLKLLNKIAGAVLFLLIFFFIFSTLLWLFNQVNLISPEIKVHSYTYHLIEPLAPAVINTLGSLIPFIKDTFQSLESFFEELAMTHKHINT